MTGGPHPRRFCANVGRQSASTWQLPSSDGTTNPNFPAAKWERPPMPQVANSVPVHLFFRRPCACAFSGRCLPEPSGAQVPRRFFCGANLG